MSAIPTLVLRAANDGNEPKALINSHSHWFVVTFPGKATRKKESNSMDNVFGQNVDQLLKSPSDLRGGEKAWDHWIDNKVIDHVDELSRRFIAASSLAILSSSRHDGILDVSPRGDPAGFAKVINKKLIAIPDRPGNNRMDTFENIFGNPNIGMIFVIPGHRDTLRISGKGAVIRDAELGERLSINGRPAELVLLVHVERVLCHCSKAFVRGKVWQRESWPDASDVPTLAEMMKVHGEMPESLEEIEGGVKEDRETNLY